MFPLILTVLYRDDHKGYYTPGLFRTLSIREDIPSSQFLGNRLQGIRALRVSRVLAEGIKFKGFRASGFRAFLRLKFQGFGVWAFRLGLGRTNLWFEDSGNLHTSRAARSKPQP